MMLQLHLQEGFESERVVVSIDDIVHLDDPIVRTKMQIGLAKMVEIDTTKTSVLIRVELPARGRSGSISVRPQETPNVGVSVASDGRVLFSVQAEPFGYL
jgi:hypothetical protein